MADLRVYGNRPFDVVVVHGGPGAAGEMAPVARALADRWGVLEPWQTATSVLGQVEELAAVLNGQADLPVTLIGYSWGAWLCYLCAASHPALVKKLILVSGAPFDEKYTSAIQATRLGRLSEDERREIQSMMEAMKDPAVGDKDVLLARFGELFTKADACDPLLCESQATKVSWDIHTRVWKEAAQWRSSGRLLAMADRIKCPVVALHGDHDPHPAEGVSLPLKAVLSDFHFVLLRQCGHKPWIERQAVEAFYATLRDALSQDSSSDRCDS